MILKIFSGMKIEITLKINHLIRFQAVRFIKISTY